MDNFAEDYITGKGSVKIIESNENAADAADEIATINDILGKKR